MFFGLIKHYTVEIQQQVMALDWGEWSASHQDILPLGKIVHFTE